MLGRAVLVRQVVRPSFRLCFTSVTLGYRGHIDWSTSKIISWLGGQCLQNPISRIYSKGNATNFGRSMGVVYLFIVSHSHLLLCSERTIITIEESLYVVKNTLHASRGFSATVRLSCF